MDGSATKPTFTTVEVEEVAAVVRRVVRARVSDSHLADDLVQETLARVLSRRPVLEPEALRPYAIVTAKHLIASMRRTDGRHADAAHRLVDLRSVEAPEDEVLHREERRSMSLAMSNLSDRDREVLISHEVNDVTTRELAEGGATTPGAIAVRLAAARAKLRVEYVLSHRREAPLPRECKSVLVAVSAGDRRRQRSLDADGHLVTCDRCSTLSEPLLSRSRASAALLPVVALRGAVERAGVAMRRHPARTTAAGVTAVAIAAGLLVTQTAGDDERRAAPAPAVADAPGADAAAPATGPTAPGPFGPGPVTVAGEPLGTISRERAVELVGRAVEVRAAVVSAVPSDEGFWVDGGGGARSWIQLGTSGESAVTVAPGDVVTFTGTLVATPSDHAAAAGVARDEGADELLARGVHVEVPADDVVVE